MNELRKLANCRGYCFGGCMTTLNELRSQADEIAAAGHAGWGNTMRDAADEIDRLTREAVAADIRIANDALVIAELRAERDAARSILEGTSLSLAKRSFERDAAQADAKRLEWLSQQGVSFGFQDIYEGNKWEIGGPYATLRIAIDAEMKGEQP